MSALRERSIILVEDSEEDYAAFRRALNKTGAEASLIRYADGEACLKGLRSDEGRNTALVILDLNLPIQTGHEVLHEIRHDARLRGLPVVVLTTSANPSDVRACYDLGIGGYIVKEGDFQGFCQKIERLAHYWLGAVHLP